MLDQPQQRRAAVLGAGGEPELGSERYSSVLTLHELPVPRPAADEVLVRVHASSINPIDVLVARGKYRWGRFEFPTVPGWDFAGTVERTGAGVTRFRVGDAVFGYWSKRRFHDGAWAEYLTIAETGWSRTSPPR